MMRTLAYIAFLLISPEIFAGVFDPIPTDKSVSLLGIIFGDQVGNIALGGTANPVLASMMDTFNFIIVVVGTVVVSYVTVLSTINTAQEGTAMGKKWSAVWIPMRSVAGMALMVPSPGSGYSMIQVTVMWIVIQGIGAANQLWDIALQGLTSGVSVSAGSTSDPRLLQAGQTLAVQLFNAATCMETIYQAAKEPANVSSGQWAATSGQYVKNYNVQDNAASSGVIGSYSGIPATTTGASYPLGANNIYTSTATGNIYFGVDDSSNAGNAVCGQLKVTAIVKSTDFPMNNTTHLNDPQITTDDVDKLAQNAYDIKINTVVTMLATLSSLAKSLVNDTATTPADIPSLEGGQPTPTGYIGIAAQDYVDAMSALVKPGGYNSSAPTINTGVTNLAVDPLNVGGANITDNSAAIQQIVAAGITNGWISAGSFYFIFNQTLTPQYLDTATANPIVDAGSSSSPLIPTLSCVTIDPCLQSAYTNTPTLTFPPADDTNVTSLAALSSLGVLTSLDTRKLTQYLAFSQVYQKNDVATGGGSSAFSSGSNASDVAGMAGGANALILQNLRNVMEGGNGDPLMAHAIFGRGLMIAAEVIISAAFLIMLLMVPTTLQVLGTGAGDGPFLIVLAITAALLGYLGTMWAFGAMLAIYMPFIPFMIFDLTALGWMLTVVEAIIAAPIIALGLVMPSGDEMGKLEHALMLLANIFLRPLLMIFGFLLAGGVYRAVVTLIDFGMADVMDSIQVNTEFSSLALISVYVTFIVGVTNQSFSLIYAVPDKILRWLGVSGEQTNVSAVGEVKQASDSSNKALGNEASKQVGGVGTAAGQAGAAAAKKGGGGGGEGGGGGGGGGGH